jgi:hypothetical protein
MIFRHTAYTFLGFIAFVLMGGCHGRSASFDHPAFEGTAVAPVEKMTYTASEKDPFNAANGVESTRKTTSSSLGVYRGKLPDPTLTSEALAAVLREPGMKEYSSGLFDNKPLFLSTFPFDYENDVASLKSLYTLHSLDRVIRPGMTEMEKCAALCLCTNRFLAGGALPGPETMTGPSAFLITRNMREKGIGGASDVYAALMCQLVLSCGYTARIVGMHTLDGAGMPLRHTVCEVYVNDLGEWVAFDPYSRATYYTRGTVPLSVLDIHVLACENCLREITPVSGTGDLTDITDVREGILPRYRYLYVWRMNDILGKSPRNGSISWQTLYDTHLVWEDNYSPVSRGGFDKVEAFAKGGVRFVTHTRTDFAWNLDVVNVTVDRTPDGTVRYHFNTVTPNFVRFDATDTMDPLNVGSIWIMKDVIQMVVGSVNAFGVVGEKSVVQVMDH